MNIRVLIVDDEPLAVERLKQCLAGMAGVEVVGEAADGDAAAQRIAELAPDLVLLDIQMPGPNGMAVARALAARGDGPEVVFVTAFAEFAHVAFELEATDYLLKPVRFDRVAEAIRRARRRLDLRQRGDGDLAPAAQPPPAPSDAPAYQTEFWIKRRDGFVRVDIAQIQRIEAARDYALLHTATRTHILRITMGDLEQRLDPAHLRRVHRSAFVRLSTVRRVERNGRNLMRLHAEDGAVIDVGASYSKKIAAALHLDHPAMA
jgi:two-component system LytT family response regulator